MHQEMHIDGSIEVAGIYDDLASMLKSSGRLKEALENSFKALEIRKRLKGNETLHLAESYHANAYLLERLGRLEEASESYSLAGTLLYMLGRFEEAMKNSDKALEIKRELYGDDAIETAHDYHTIGCILMELRRYEEALEKCSKGLEIRKAKGEEKLQDIAESYMAVGLIFQRAGKFEEALDRGLQALNSLKEKNHQPAFIAKAHVLVGRSLQQMGRIGESLEHLDQALDILKKLEGQESLLIAQIYNLAVGLSIELEAWKKVDHCMERAIEISEKFGGQKYLYIDPCDLRKLNAQSTNKYNKNY
ncbi:tetratricopeptide repeat protein [Rhabdochlamydiaceae symbiont of Dictyostelium giganteum]|uniref:tetratricopeptide repeat protein n=1 Tax=Rhabdochlamydiaceae symbiont of Dictyostelium giganteum TaxID=3342349 RepID=UPI00384D1AF3